VKTALIVYRSRSGTTRRLAEVSPGWSATHLGNALIRAAEALTDKARRSTARRLKAAYDALGRDRAEADVERYVSIQAEALLDG
jgi:hypothetical protein